jgi:hypothetical protein
VTASRIVVTHLTRMNEGNVCIAGYDEASGAERRPVLSGYQRISRTLLSTATGLVVLGSVLEFDDLTRRPSPPEVEDVVFEPSGMRLVGYKTPREIWTHISRVAKQSLDEVFGPDLQATSNTHYLPLRKGVASLGYVIPSAQVELETSFGKVKASVEIAREQRWLAVTDLRLYKADNSPDVTAMATLNLNLRRGAVLAVGVGRAMWSSNIGTQVHWVQVNSLHAMP